MSLEVLRLKKACESVFGWKQFSCQNVKAGDIFGINLFLRLSLILSVTLRNGSDAVQICPNFVYKPLHSCQMVPASPGPCFQLVNQTSAVNIFITVHSSTTALPGTSGQLQRTNVQAWPLGGSIAQ